MYSHSNSFGRLFGQDYATFINSSIQSQYVAFKADITAKINAMQTRPSFDTQTIEMDAGDTRVLTDTRGVLKDYQSIDRTVNGIRFQHNYGENTLTITITDSCNIENYYLTDLVATGWGLIKEESADYDTTIYFEFPNGVQNQLRAMHYNDPVPMALNLKINLAGNLEITKTNTNGNLVDGTVFNLTGPNGYNQNHVVSGGKLLVEKLRKGTYTLKEVNSVNRLLNKCNII